MNKRFADKYGPWAIIAGASEGTGRVFAYEIAANSVSYILIVSRYLAELMGVLSGHTDWEQEDADCSVQAVIDFYGTISLKYKPDISQDYNKENVGYYE